MCIKSSRAGVDLHTPMTTHLFISTMCHFPRIAFQIIYVLFILTIKRIGSALKNGISAFLAIGNGLTTIQTLYANRAILTIDEYDCNYF